MSPQIMAALTMFMITAAAASAFIWPIVKFPNKDRVINFYWSGFWIFLAMITAFAGAQSTLTLLGQDVTHFSAAVLFAMTLTFVIFVIFGWARLVIKGAQHLITNIAVE